MCDRIVGLTLIVAVIACPVWCGTGLCYADQYCPANQAMGQDCGVHETIPCCCQNKPSHTDDNRGPSRCPDTSCQGVCGGAVFEKPIEINDAADSFFLPLVDTEILCAVQLAECRTVDGARQWHCLGGNYGRLMRMLHSSYLC